jgi:peptidoglycan/LPS O-acetylase OafA/YrhL
MPTYLFGSVLVIAASLMASESNLLSLWGYTADLRNDFGNVSFKIYLIFTNFTLFFQDIIMFMSSRNGQVHWTTNFIDTDARLWHGLAIRQAWSLGIELSFYLLAPFLLRLLSSALAILAVICLISKFLIIFRFGLSDPWTYRFFPFELGYFLIGSLSFRLTASLASRFEFSGGKFYTAIVYIFVAFLATSSGYFPGEAVFYPLALGALLPFIFLLTDGNKIDRWIGEFSYPFYILHLLAFSLVGLAARRFSLIPVGSETWIALVFTLILSYVALALELRFVEPWRAGLGRPGNPSAPQAEAISTSVMAPDARR